MTKEAKAVVLEVGGRVSHKLFGEGLIKEITRSQNGCDVHAYIEFDEPHQRSENSPSTRFRKILSTYVQKLEWQAPDSDENEESSDNQ